MSQSPYIPPPEPPRPPSRVGYVVSDSNGAILRWGTCAPTDFDRQARAGELVFPLEATPDPLSQRVDVATGTLIDYQPPKPADTALVTYEWADRRWIPSPTLLALEQGAHAAIDDAAGKARGRYITDVPGQQAVYLRKAEQARAYRDAGYAGAVSPYVQAEADAMQMTPAEAADRILAVAELWDDTLSPTIERERIGGKARVTAAKQAGDRTAIQLEKDAAIAALGAI